MINNAYLESRILSADAVELVRMLYQGALDAVLSARDHLAHGRIAERSTAISKAIEILMELNASLDHDNGGEISRNLARLYAYMQQRLLDANLRQADQPLAETAELLATLTEGWQEVRREAPAAAKPDGYADQPQATVPGWGTAFAIPADSGMRGWCA